MHQINEIFHHAICSGGKGDDATRPFPHVIYVIDDDCGIRDGVRDLCQGEGYGVETFSNCEIFLEAYHPWRGVSAC